jgi:hypothetical protein
MKTSSTSKKVGARYYIDEWEGDRWVAHNFMPLREAIKLTNGLGGRWRLCVKTRDSGDLVLVTSSELLGAKT